MGWQDDREIAEMFGGIREINPFKDGQGKKEPVGVILTIDQWTDIKNQIKDLEYKVDMFNKGLWLAGHLK